MESRPRSFSQARISFEKDVPGWGKIQPKGGGPSFLSAAKEKKKKKAIRHRGRWGPRIRKGQWKGANAVPPWGLFAPEKRCFEATFCRGSSALWDSRQLRCPKVSKGERREAGIQWIQPPKAVSDPEFRQTTSGAHGSANRADCLPRGKPFGAPAGAHPLPWMGIDAPAAARVGICHPMGFSPASVPEGFQRASGKPFGAPAGAYPCPGGE